MGASRALLHLIYYSGLDVIREAFKKVTARQSLEQGKSIIGREWNTFTDLLLERLVIKHQMDRANESSDVGGKAVRCSNVILRFSLDFKPTTHNSLQYGKPNKDNNFQRCSRCRTPYCSKQCQTIARKEKGHKALCKSGLALNMSKLSRTILVSDFN